MSATPPRTPAYAHALRAAFDHVLYTLAQLEPDEIERAQMNNGWTPKALVAHLAFWDDAQRQRMEAALRGAPLATRPSAHENDARAAAEQRPFADVLAAAEAARAALIDFAAQAPPDALARVYDEGGAPLSIDRLLAHMVEHTNRHGADLYQFVASAQRWGKAGLLRLLENQHNMLMESVAGLDEATILSTLVSDGWSLRDHLVHLLAWDEYTCRVVMGWPAVERAALAEWVVAGEDEDQTNARLQAARADLNMIEIVDGLATWHRRTQRHVEALDDEALCAYGDNGWGGQVELCQFLYSQCLHQAEHALQMWETRR